MKNDNERRSLETKSIIIGAIAICVSWGLYAIFIKGEPLDNTVIKMAIMFFGPLLVITIYFVLVKIIYKIISKIKSKWKV